MTEVVSLQGRDAGGPHSTFGLVHAARQVAAVCAAMAPRALTGGVRRWHTMCTGVADAVEGAAKFIFVLTFKAVLRVQFHGFKYVNPPFSGAPSPCATLRCSLPSHCIVRSHRPPGQSSPGLASAWQVHGASAA